MKSNRMMMAALAIGTIGASGAMLKALENDAADRRYAVDADKRKAGDMGFGPGTGTVPPGFEPTERDKARMAAAEERRIRRQARNLRNLK